MRPDTTSGLGENAAMHPHSPADTASAVRPQADPHKANADVPLAPGENVLSRLEVDLDARLCFHASSLVLTDRRLLSRSDSQVAANDGMKESYLGAKKKSEISEMPADSMKDQA